VLRALGVSERQARVLYNGYQEPARGVGSGAAFRQRLGLANELLILHVASVKPNKGHHLMLDAVRTLRARGRAVRYVAVGSTSGLWADYAADVQRQITSQGLTDSATLLGHLSDEELAEAYDAADVVVVPSLAETFPLAALDAMAWGKALVATDCGGVREMVLAERTGLLVSPGRADQLTEALDRLVGDRALRESLGTRAAAFVQERYSWDSVLQRYERLCYQLVGTSPATTDDGQADREAIREPLPAVVAGR
jgi:glycosyltransferase involved in cell wall biosynthesis